MARAGMTSLAVIAGLSISLTGCDRASSPLGFLKSKEAPYAVAPAEVRTTEQDVEAPEVFQAADEGLWDGRPSLGGIWVATPDAKDPERVLIRNTANGQSVVGALFRRERDNPGPAIQVSSDAAEALGMLAGQPAQLEVVALRKAEVPVEPAPTTETPLPTAETIEAQPLAPITETAAAALDRVDAGATKPATGTFYLQVATLSSEERAKAAAKKLEDAGLGAEVQSMPSGSKTVWRVIAGPGSDRDALLANVKALGFTDAFFLSR